MSTKPSKTCLWSEDQGRVWYTSCDQAWQFVDYETDDRMRFCCYCGRPLRLQEYVPPEEDEGLDEGGA